MIHTQRGQGPWVVIVEPDAEAKLLVVVTVYEGSPMTERSLQVTYRKGRTFAAYLHLSHPTGEKSARTVASPDGLLIVDYASSGRALGVEITAPQAVPLNRLNQLLAELGEPLLAEQDYRPARAA
jgi:hypothetical protein